MLSNIETGSDFAIGLICISAKSNPLVLTASAAIRL